jgi:hypothetical protein
METFDAILDSRCHRPITHRFRKHQRQGPSTFEILRSTRTALVLADTSSDILRYSRVISVVTTAQDVNAVFSLCHTVAFALFALRRILTQKIRRTNRAPLEIPAAVRTHSGQVTINAVATKCALESTDHGVRGIRGQCFVAAFANGAKLKHGS